MVLVCACKCCGCQRAIVKDGLCPKCFAFILGEWSTTTTAPTEDGDYYLQISHGASFELYRLLTPSDGFKVLLSFGDSRPFYLFKLESSAKWASRDGGLTPHRIEEPEGI